jgi:hypothetical protein
MKTLELEMKIAKSLTYITTVMLLAVIWLYPHTVLAQGEVTPEELNPISELLMMVLKVVFSILGILTTWLVTKGITFFERKTKIDIPASYENTIFGWADKGIGLANEKAHQTLKEQGKKLKGPEKMDIALGFVNTLIQQHKLDAMAQDKLKTYIEAKLGMTRGDKPVPAELPAA